MGLSQLQRQALYAVLHDVRDRELDCDEHLAHLPAELEGRLDSVAAEAMRHHRRVCPECEEERLLLVRALQLDERNPSGDEA